MGKTRGNLDGGGAKIVTGTYSAADVAVDIGFEPDFVSVDSTYVNGLNRYYYSATEYKDYSFDMYYKYYSPTAGGTASDGGSFNNSYITISSSGFTVSSSISAYSALYGGTYIAGKY